MRKKRAQGQGGSGRQVWAVYVGNGCVVYGGFHSLRPSRAILARNPERWNLFVGSILPSSVATRGLATRMALGVRFMVFYKVDSYLHPFAFQFDNASTIG